MFTVAGLLLAPRVWSAVVAASSRNCSSQEFDPITAELHTTTETQLGLS